MHADLLFIGLGYAGLPLARKAALAGLAVAGLGTRHRPRGRQWEGRHLRSAFGHDK